MEYRILVADDSKKAQLLIIDILNKHGAEFKVMSVPNGKLACKLAEVEMPDLILMDWEMPEMSGIDALISLKKNSKTKDIPVIMVTGLSYEEDMDYALQQGAVDYIKKPYDKVELVTRIRNVLRKNNAEKS